MAPLLLVALVAAVTAWSEVFDRGGDVASFAPPSTTSASDPKARAPALHIDQVRNSKRERSQANVEARLLMLLQGAARRHAPPELFAESGLLKNNVSVACEQVGEKARMDCHVGLIGATSGDALLVVYEKDRGGPEHIRWYWRRNR